MTELQVLGSQEQADESGRPYHVWPLGDTQWAQFFRRGDGYLVRFPGLADFLLSPQGDRVACRPAPGVTQASIEHLYLNQVRPLAISKAGRLAFHGSAVAVEGRACVFIGESHRGKSTLAASFALAGRPFLSDDAVELVKSVAGYRVLPSHASLRLWDDSREALAITSRAAAPVQYTPKARLLPDDTLPHQADELPLGHVYYLGDGSSKQVTIEPLRPQQAIVEWLKHSFLLELDEPAMLRGHFDQIADLSNAAAHFRLDYPREFHWLEHVRAAILAHARDP